MSSTDSDASSTITTASSSPPPPSAAGPITEDEIRAVLLQEAPVKIPDLIAKFRERLEKFEDKKAFCEVVMRICDVQKTNGSNYVVLRDESFPVFFKIKDMCLEGYDSSLTSTASTQSAGPVTEDEIKAFLLQKTMVKTMDLVVNFRPRLGTPEAKMAFAEVLSRICKIQTTNGSKYVDKKDFSEVVKQICELQKTNGSNYVVLRDESFPVFFSKIKNMCLEGYDSSLTSTASTQSAGPVTEDEIKAFMLQKTMVKTMDLVVNFRPRLQTPEARMAFAEVLRRICKIQTTSNYVALRDELFPVFFNKIKNMSLEGSDSSLTNTASTPSAGPVTEDEIKVFLLQKAPVTTWDLVANFRARLGTPEAKMAFAEVLRRICKIPKTNGPTKYVVLRDE